MTFISFARTNNIFVRNAHRWEVFFIKPIYLIVDTNTYRNNFLTLRNKTFEITINAINEFSFSNNTILKLNATFTEMEDMNTYLIATRDSSNFTHAYGDSYFERNIEKYYSGPNKQFGVLPLTKDKLR